MVERRLDGNEERRAHKVVLGMILSLTLGVGASIVSGPASAQPLESVLVADVPDPTSDFVELSVDRSEVDANNPISTFTLSPSVPIASSYWLSVCDDTGQQVYSCWYGHSCATAGDALGVAGLMYGGVGLGIDASAAMADQWCRP